MIPNWLRIFIPAMLIAAMFRIFMIAFVRLLDGL